MEDLRDVPEAAWLWDGQRARIVWANTEGIAFFGAASMFDLIDRPFDFIEPGVERIVGLSRSLRRGQVETALLHFPSAGATAPIACRCMIHALADGRPGVLAVARDAAGVAAQKMSDDILAAFDVLPTAALLVGRDGNIRHLNAAALVLLAAGQRASLAALLGDADIAEDLLTRLATAGTISFVRSMQARLGARDIRLTARLIHRAGDRDASILILLDDVTERRALEQALIKSAQEEKANRPDKSVPEADASNGDAKPMSPVDSETFEKLGRTLEDDLRHVPRRRPTVEPATQKPETAYNAAAPEPGEDAKHRRRKPLPRLPQQVRAAFDARRDAILIAKDGVLLYANPAAAAFFGFESAEDVINDDLLADRFGQLGQSLPSADIALDSGRLVQACVQMAMIPWQGGPARQFAIHKIDPAKAEAKAKTEELRIPAAPDRKAQPAPPGTGAAEAAQSSPPSPPVAEVIQLPVRTGNGGEADQELRAILDTAADGIITLDADAKIHTFSAGAEAIFGYRIADVAGKPFIELLSAESRKTVRDYLAALQGPGLASVFNDGREVEAVVRQGGRVPLFLTIGRLQAPTSQAAFCAVVRDITQWKKTESELREAKEKAEATSRQKSEFLARISHELRTPLNAIMGFSEVMRLERFGEIDNEKYRGYVQDIHASGSHLLSLINDLLDLSKVEAGKLELNFTAVSLSDVADHAMKMLQEQATAARVVLRKAMPADLPNVVADLRSMRQIMLNLLSNAVKFTDPGGQVMISAQVIADGSLKLRVKDTGIGMTEEQLEGALEPFQRISTEGRDVQGTGLGLPLTKALVEANRAVFTLASEPRKGTLAEITFPTTRVLAG